MQPVARPYGTWSSIISAARTTAGVRTIRQLVVDGAAIYWVEERPDEAGRHVAVEATSSGLVERTFAPFNCRTRVHEYGGGALAVASGTVFFSNGEDQRLYRQARGASPEALTPDGPWRYADASVDLHRRALFAVRETHGGRGEPVNCLVRIDLDRPGAGTTIASGHDFYAAPRLSPDRTALAWLSWNHPDMPWNGTELTLGTLDAAGSVVDTNVVAGSRGESVQQPAWGPNGDLFFVSDRTDWWNLYRLHEGTVTPVCPLDAEFGLPPWMLGTSTYGIVSSHRLVCMFGQRGLWRLASIDVESGGLTPFETDLEPFDFVRATPTEVVFVGGTPTTSPGIYALALDTGRLRCLRTTSDEAVDASYVSVPESFEFETTRGTRAQAFYYPPANPAFTGPDDAKPPLIVVSHGGPTAATDRRFNIRLQFWTSRGFAVVDVNYSGSTGFGRASRDRLDGAWGIVDVDDCVSAARALVARWLADPERLAIRGGSAGGFTTLAALAFRDVFRAGASYYGVADLELLARDTHKFESRYLERLIGPYPARADLYRARSPVHAADRIACPVIVFQGLEDEVVPPNQAETIVAALRTKGVPVALLTFPGEQHGFRRAETIVRCLEAELAFYGAIFGFEPAEALPPLLIENFPRRRA